MDNFRAIILSVSCGALFYALVSQIVENITMCLHDMKKRKKGREPAPSANGAGSKGNLMKK